MSVYSSSNSYFCLRMFFKFSHGFDLNLVFLFQGCSSGCSFKYVFRFSDISFFSSSVHLNPLCLLLEQIFKCSLFVPSYFSLQNSQTLLLSRVFMLCKLCLCSYNSCLVSKIKLHSSHFQVP